MSFVKGDTVNNYNGWSAIIDEVVVPGIKYLIRFDGCEVPYDSTEQWPQGKEFLIVYHDELKSRKAMANDNETHKDWCSWFPAQKVTLKSITVGQFVTWAVYVDERNLTQEYSGIVKSLHSVGQGYCLIYTGEAFNSTMMVPIADLDA